MKKKPVIKKKNKIPLPSKKPVRPIGKVFFVGNSTT